MNKTSLPPTVLRSLVLASALACAAVPSMASGWSWFGGETVQGSGAVKRQARQVAHFSGLAFELPGTLELRLADSEGVTIETDDNLLPLVETVVENGTLKIRPTKRNMSLRTRNLRVVVNARQIDSLSLGGSGTINADVLRAPRLDISLGGSGEINVGKLDSDLAVVSVGGSADFKAGGGTARKLSVSIGGSGDVDTGRVQSDSASVSLAGSGDATVWARQELSISIAGSGDVNYYGDPRISKSVVGSGDARRLGGAPR